MIGSLLHLCVSKVEVAFNVCACGEKPCLCLWRLQDSVKEIQSVCSFFEYVQVVFVGRNHVAAAHNLALWAKSKGVEFFPTYNCGGRGCSGLCRKVLMVQWISLVKIV